MRVSIKWLKEFVDFDLSVEELADALTMSGLEIDTIEKLDSGLDKVVVGQIARVRKHPTAEKLVLCDVDIGEKTVQIVCGAPNTREGMLAPTALVGAKLPSGMEIKAARLRGEHSYGMLCSEKELGFSDDAAGLMELSTDLAVGVSLAQALGRDDTALEIDLTPNRPDCLSISGVAREISAITGNPLNPPEISVLYFFASTAMRKNKSVPEGDTAISSLTSVTIEDPDLCPRYAARIIRGVKIGPSPAWMQQRLEAVGLRGINNVVDVTNYVLMELGHPLHAFDYHKLTENRIVVRRARLREEIVTIDEETRDLTDDMLVIADAQNAVALAGIMGGLDSEVTVETTDILLESAYFNPVSIRKTSKALGMHTEASHRFERGADIEGLITAINRAAQLIQEVAGGEICRGIVDAYPIKHEPVKIQLRPERVNFVLGTDIPTSEMKDILTRLQFVVSEELQVTVPTFRPDVTREEDLIEEIARIHGYDNIPIVLPKGSIPQVEHIGEDGAESQSSKELLREKAASIMLKSSLSEAINYSFYSPNVFDLINLPADSPQRKVMSLRKPLSETQSIMRTTLIPSLLENVRWNINHQVADVKLFELSHAFSPEQPDELPHEHEMIAGVLSGSMSAGLWNDKTREVDFFDVKGIVELLLEEFGITEYEIKPIGHPTLHPSRSAQIVMSSQAKRSNLSEAKQSQRSEGEAKQSDLPLRAERGNLGIMGEVHPDVLDNHDIPQRVYIFELDFDKLAELAQTERYFQTLPQFPGVLRDLAIVVSEDISSEEVTRIIKTAGGELITSLKLFDVYTGKPIPEGKKNLAYSIEYTSPSRTLTDEEVETVHQRIITQLSSEIGAELRK